VFAQEKLAKLNALRSTKNEHKFPKTFAHIFPTNKSAQLKHSEMTPQLNIHYFTIDPIRIKM
jgi:hypothetical protein